MPGDVLEVGDVMRFSLELIDVLKAQGPETMLVRVQRIDRQPDGTVKLWLDHADAPPRVTQ